MRQKVKGGDRPSRRPSRGDEPRASLYDSVTNRIIAELEDGRLPWVQPWGRSGGASAALPHNAHSGRVYSGINILILWGAVIEAGWPSQGWLTFRQALEAGGNVCKGERGTTVVYADRFVPKGEAERAALDGGTARAVPFLKSFTVFNVAQCEGLREGIGIDPAPLPEREIVPVGDRACRRARRGRRRDQSRLPRIWDRHFRPPVPEIAVPRRTARRRICC